MQISMQLKLFPTLLTPTFWGTLLRRLMRKNLKCKRSLTPKAKRMKRKKKWRTKLKSRGKRRGKSRGWKKKAKPQPQRSPRR